MTDHPTPRSIVEEYYDQMAGEEWNRLDRHRMEFAISLRALEEYLPPAPAAVLDVGGGPGRYSIELAKRGYQVTLVDLSSANLELARQKAAEASVQLHDIRQGNALDLSAFPEGGYDAVLLMGPLYHLLEPEERQQAVRQAMRCLKPNGRLFAAFINRFGVFRDAAAKQLDFISEDPAYAFRILETGRHDKQAGFTRSYFAHPMEIIPFMERLGLKTLDLINCEGFVGNVEELPNRLEGEAWQVWLDLNYRVAKDPAARGLAGHLLYAGKRGHK